MKTLFFILLHCIVLNSFSQYKNNISDKAFEKFNAQKESRFLLSILNRNGYCISTSDDRYITYVDSSNSNEKRIIAEFFYFPSTNNEYSDAALFKLYKKREKNSLIGLIISNQDDEMGPVLITSDDEGNLNKQRLTDIFDCLKTQISNDQVDTTKQKIKLCINEVKRKIENNDFKNQFKEFEDGNLIIKGAVVYSLIIELKPCIQGLKYSWKIFKKFRFCVKKNKN